MEIKNMIEFNKNGIVELAISQRKLSKAELERDIIDLLNKGQIDEGDLNSLLIKVTGFFTHQPVSMKAKTNPFYWVSQAISADDSRRQLRLVYVSEFEIVGTDGKRLHIVQNTDNLPEGLYDAKTGVINEKESKFHSSYPNYRQVIPISLPHKKENLRLSDFTLNTIDGRACLEYEGIKLIRKHALEAFAGFGTCTLRYSDNSSPVILEFNANTKAVLMPLRRWHINK